MVANYAGSVGQLAQNEIVLSAQDRAAHEAMLERLIRARENAAAHQLQSQALQQRAKESQVGQNQFQQTLEANAARDARIGNYQNEELSQRRDESSERNRMHADDQDWRRKVFEMNQKTQDAQELMPYANEMAERGMFGSTEDVIKHFPTLAKQADSIAAKSRAIRSAQMSEQNWAKGAAEAINAPTRYQNMIDAERQVNVTPVRTWRSRLPGTDITFDDAKTAAARAAFSNPNIAEWSAAKAAAQPAADRFSKMLESNPRMMGIASPNPETGMMDVTRTLPWSPSGSPISDATSTSSGSGIPSDAVKLLRSNPQLAPQFDAKYGRGAASAYLNRIEDAPPSDYMGQ